MSEAGAESGDEQQQMVAMDDDDHAETFEGQGEDDEEEYDDGEEGEEEGEEEDEEKEDGEEEEEEESDEGSPSKKQKVVGNDVLFAQNQRLQGRVGLLNQEIEQLNTDKRLLEEANASLREKNAALQQDLEGCQTRITGLNTALAALASSPVQPLSSAGAAVAGPSAGPSTAIVARRRKVFLGMVIRTPSGRPLHEVTTPYRFPDTGSFPHAVDDNSRTHLRENQVEQRRITNFVFAATFEDGSSAREYDIKPDGLVPYQMQFLYADNNVEVQTGDFTKAVVDALCHPKQDLIGTRNMVNGELVFTINRFNVASTDTAPRHRAFVVRVTPTDPALANDPDLTVTSPPFVIRAKVTAPKADPFLAAASAAVTVNTGPSTQGDAEEQQNA